MKYHYYSLRSTEFLIFSSIKILSLTIALLLPQHVYAESEIYGSINYDYQQSSKNTPQNPPYTPSFNIEAPPQGSDTPSSKSRSQSSIQNNDSHIGIKGQKDIGNGTAIIYQLELGNEK